MIVQFELRPLDSRQFEEWHAHRVYRYAPYAIGWLLLAALGLFVTSLRMSLRDLPGGPLMAPLLALLPLAALFLMRPLARRAFPFAAAVTEGTHSLHFSEAGIHHTAPTGAYRYPWGHFRGVEVTVGYLFFRFVPEGMVPIPVEALSAFGATPDADFLSSLEPLVRAGREA